MKSRRIRWAGLREMRNTYKILFGKPDGRRQVKN
jgi:hypothetical protein